MDHRLFGTKPLSEPRLKYCHLDPPGQTSVKSLLKFIHFYSRKCIRKICLKISNMFTIHYTDVKMGAMASQITSLTIVFSTVYFCTDQRKHQSSASLAFVRGIHRRPVNSPHKWPVTREMFPFDEIIMWNLLIRVPAVVPGLNSVRPSAGEILITQQICYVICYHQESISIPDASPFLPVTSLQIFACGTAEPPFAINLIPLETKGKMVNTLKHEKNGWLLLTAFSAISW